MRDIKTYPITTAEIVATLKRLRDQAQKEIEETGLVGNIDVLIIGEAIERIWQLDDLKTS